MRRKVGCYTGREHSLVKKSEDWGRTKAGDGQRWALYSMDEQLEICFFFYQYKKSGGLLLYRERTQAGEEEFEDWRRTNAKNRQRRATYIVEKQLKGCFSI